jgi:hypothetical protein
LTRADIIDEITAVGTALEAKEKEYADELKDDSNGPGSIIVVAFHFVFSLFE